MVTELLHSSEHRGSALAGLICLLLLLFLLARSPWSEKRAKAPLIEIPKGVSRRRYFLENAARLWQRGYQKYPRTPFLIPNDGGSTTLVLPPKYLDSLKTLPDSTLSFEAAFSDSMSGYYTHVPPKGSFQLTAHAIKADLTPHLASINPQVSDLVERTIVEGFPEARDWTSCNINRELLRMVAIVTGSIFIGPEYGKDETYIDIASNYTVEVMTANFTVRYTPAWVRPLIAHFLPPVRALRKRERMSERFFAPLLEKRRQAAARGDALPDDMMTWMMKRGSQREIQTVTRQAELQLGLTFAAVHTTTMTATSVLYNLAAMPTYAADLRREAEQALAAGKGVFTTAALQKLPKLDSFIKETMRFDTIAIDAFSRNVLEPFTLPDGTFVPAGSHIAIPWQALSRDPEFYKDPDHFDGYRFVRDIDPTTGKASATNQFVGMSREYLLFGYGKHACPGRFFAANIVKTMVALLLLRYDLQNADGSKERYPNINIGQASMPDPDKEILLKSVTS